ncbi:MAG: hypothetical protein FK734_16955 [Asgard group archaeon]|nr:hypothetical protein [Asgard group archaeon]
MSLKNAKAVKNGIYLFDGIKHTLIVPMKIKLTSSFDLDHKVSSSVNKSLYFLLAQNIEHYTICLKRVENKNPMLTIFAYFSEPTIEALHKKIRVIIKKLIRFTNGLGLILSSMDSQKVLEEIKSRYPKSMSEFEPNIFKIYTEDKEYYISVARFNFYNDDEKKFFIPFVRDFFSLNIDGAINLDVLTGKNDSKDYSTVNIAITATFFESESSVVKTYTKKITSLIKLLEPVSMKIDKPRTSLIQLDELQKNYGKIIMGQGWAFFPGSHQDLLDFTTFLNLLNTKQ